MGGGLLAQLDELRVTTLELHWAEAYVGSWKEHNCVVVTAKGQPFRDGILLDCWRHSGHLFWSPVATDNYPWIEDRRYAAIARGKFTAKRRLQIPVKRSTTANATESSVTAAMP